MPAANAMPPTIGLNTIVCVLEMSILKNPTSATRSVVKNVKARDRQGDDAQDYQN